MRGIQYLLQQIVALPVTVSDEVLYVDKFILLSVNLLSGSNSTWQLTDYGHLNTSL